MAEVGWGADNGWDIWAVCLLSSRSLCDGHQSDNGTGSLRSEQATSGKSCKRLARIGKDKLEKDSCIAAAKGERQEGGGEH